MRWKSGGAIAVVVVLASGGTAFADVQISIGDGRVSIVATNATVGEILAEWARVGQTRVVNADRIPRERVTLQLDNVYEAQALDILLRNVSGYLAAPRATAMQNASQFDRIVVMPPSAAPKQARAAQVPAKPMPAAATAGAPTAASPGVVANTGADQARTEAASPEEASSLSRDDVPMTPGYAAAVSADFEAAYQRRAATLQTYGDSNASPSAGAFPSPGEGIGLVHPEPKTGRALRAQRRAAELEAALSRAPAEPQAPPPPAPAVENVKFSTEADAPLPTYAGSVAPPNAAFEATLGARHQLETVDPRTIKLPPGVLQTGAPRGVRPPAGAVVPGTVVQPNKPPGTP